MALCGGLVLAAEAEAGGLWVQEHVLLQERRSQPEGQRPRRAAHLRPSPTGPLKIVLLLLPQTNLRAWEDELQLLLPSVHPVRVNLGQVHLYVK